MGCITPALRKHTAEVSVNDSHTEVLVPLPGKTHAELKGKEDDMGGVFLPAMSVNGCISRRRVLLIY